MIAKFHLLAAFLLLGQTLLTARTYRETSGLVIMEMENTPSALAQWQKISKGDEHFVNGATGQSHLEYRGNTINGGDPDSPLSYTFKITKPGKYHLSMRGRKRLDGAEWDKCNDAYVRLEGDFQSGNDAYDLKPLTNDTKVYLPSPQHSHGAESWEWATQLDGNDVHKKAVIYELKKDETYTLVVSGRSIRYNLDRLVLRHEFVPQDLARNPELPESPTTDDQPKTVYLDASEDFSKANPNRVPYYLDKREDALAIDATKLEFRDRYARATTTFKGKAGTYDLFIHALKELDGESSYRLLINNEVIATAQNSTTKVDYEPQFHQFPNVKIPTEATISIESNAVSNDQIPEGDGFAFARGRWAGLFISPSLAIPSKRKALLVPGMKELDGENDVRTEVAKTARHDVLIALHPSQEDRAVRILLNQKPVTDFKTIPSSKNKKSASITFPNLKIPAGTEHLEIEPKNTQKDLRIKSIRIGREDQVALNRLVLVNAKADTDILPLYDGAFISLTAIGTNQLNFRAETPQKNVTGMKFKILETGEQSIDRTRPFSLAGDDEGDYQAWAPELRKYTIETTPLLTREGKETPGETSTVTFEILADDPSRVIVSAGSWQSLKLPENTVKAKATLQNAKAVATIQWTQVSGPSAATIENSESLTPTFTDLQKGIYQFQIEAVSLTQKRSQDHLLVQVAPARPTKPRITGERKQLHQVTLNFEGPELAESGTPNPFLDYRLDVTFQHQESGQTLRIPGYFAADGNAAHTGAEKGQIWKVQFRPSKPGLWNYQTSFMTAKNTATQKAGAGKSAGYFDRVEGSLEIGESDAPDHDFRKKGRLQYVGKHFLQFASSKDYFVKAGTDSPENLFSYADFDGPFKKDGKDDDKVKTWEPHLKDWKEGDPTWSDGKGKGLIGAMNYLGKSGINSISLLTFNIKGDDKNVFPYLDYDERERMDVSRLAQWALVLDHAQKQGLQITIKTQETENEKLLNGGDLGRHRKLYYRELIARFGHHLALTWNLGEENGPWGGHRAPQRKSQTTEQRIAMANYFAENDPYQNHLVIHNGLMPDDLLGSKSPLTGFSLQTKARDFSSVFPLTLEFVKKSAKAGRPWVVACDEPGDTGHALRPANDKGSSWKDARVNALWGNFMAGGAGCEFYFGYKFDHSDLTCQDFRSRDGFWKYCRAFLNFFEIAEIPFTEMTSQNDLTSAEDSWCLAKDNDTYLILLKKGGMTELDLSKAGGPFSISWFNPRKGAKFRKGTITEIAGGQKQGIGMPPFSTESDWVVLVQRTAN